MFLNKIVHINHGVTATRFDGSKVHNSCFFLSVAASMKMDYESVFNLGSFPESIRGHMVDVFDHETNISQLATSLKHRIAIHTGERNGDHIFIPDSEFSMVFPLSGDASVSDNWEVINIVHVSDHFMTFITAEEAVIAALIETQRNHIARLAVEEAATAALIAEEALIAVRMEARRNAMLEEERNLASRLAKEEAATIAFLLAEGLISDSSVSHFVRV